MVKVHNFTKHQPSKPGSELENLESMANLALNPMAMAMATIARSSWPIHSFPLVIVFRIRNNVKIRLDNKD